MHHIFVDFENAPELNLAVPHGVSLSLVLLVGQKQTALKTSLVEQLLAHAANVQLVRQAASGKNALDFTLAYHVGRAVAADPGGHFHIVSKDKGFDAFVQHLTAAGTRITRHNAFAELPFLPSPPVSVRSTPNSGSQNPPDSAKDRLAEFISNLQRNPANRPKRERTLRSHLLSHLGGKLPVEEMERQFFELKRRLGLTIDPKGAVTYKFDDQNAAAAPRKAN